MANVERVTVTVSADQAALLRNSVEHGEYASASEIVREALRDWRRKHDQNERDLETLRQLIREGDASGPGIPAVDVLAELRQLIAERRAAAHEAG
jgi:antitoxin ParD1/3/4